jgi:hypothetical protein
MCFEVTVSVAEALISRRLAGAGLGPPDSGGPALAGFWGTEASAGDPWTGCAAYRGNGAVLVTALQVPAWMETEPGPGRMVFKGTPPAAGSWGISLLAEDACGRTVTSLAVTAS